MSAPDGPVVLERHGEVAVVRLSRPAVHNAIDGATAEQLAAVVETVLAETVPAGGAVRALVVTGTGRTFCAGADLSYLAGLPELTSGLAMTRRMARLLDRLAAADVPVIAAVNGAVLGGGCEVMVACHLRIAADSAKISFRQAAMGVTPGWGGGARLFRLVGRSRALRLFLTAETIDAAEALAIGLVDQVVPAEEVLPAALALARRIAAGSAAAVRGFLELARTVEGASPAAAARREEELFTELFGGEDFRRQVAAWRDRRGG